MKNWRRHCWIWRGSVAVILAAATSFVEGQTQWGQGAEKGGVDANLQMCPSSAELRSGLVVRREIGDPSSGARWLLGRDINRPGGPGRLVLAESESADSNPKPGTDDNPMSKSASRAICARRSSPRPIIRAGDRLVVEEHTALVELRLEGVALASAVAGSQFNVRLKFGGGTVRAIAKAPGVATLVTERRARQ